MPKKVTNLLRYTLGTFTYQRKLRLRGILLALPFAVTLFTFLASIKFVWDSKKSLLNPAPYLLAFSLLFSSTVAASAPKADLIHPIEPTPTPHVQTEKEFILSLPHGDIVWRIYGNESSFGQSPFIYCEKKGLINDLGYNVAHKQCFSTKKEEFETVSTWFDKELQNHTLGEALCLYNLGVNENSCKYSEDFLSL